jgi:hypothetical protein
MTYMGDMKTNDKDKCGKPGERGLERDEKNNQGH